MVTSPIADMWHICAKVCSFFCISLQRQTCLLDVQTAAGTVLAQGGMAASRAAEALRNNIRDEQELYNHFLMAVRSLLTPLQSAIAISHVSPFACHAGFSIPSKL